MKYLSNISLLAKVMVMVSIISATRISEVKGQLSATISGPLGSTCSSQPLTFTCAVSGASDVTYQWLKQDQIPISGGTQSTLTTTALSAGDVVQCYVTSSTLGSVYSNQITVPTLTQPQVFSVYINTNLTVCSGASLTLTASTNFPTGAPFVWQQATTGTQVQGNSFTVAATSLSDLQSITVQATAASSACVQNPTATANTSNIPFNILSLTYPSVSMNQSENPVVLGSAVTFTATPSGYGSGTPVYTWQLNGTTVSNVSGNTFSTTISTGAELQSVSVSMNPTNTCPQNAAVANSTFQVVSADWENQNYIRVQDILVAGISDFVTIDHLPIGQKRERTTYLDGLGRPIQKLDKSGSLVGGTSTDLVVPIVYDAAGRNAQQYMPYTTTDNPGMFKSSNVLTEQAAFVTTKFSEPSGTPTYSQTIYDNTPLKRVIKSMAPGSSWGGNNIGSSYSYDYNTAPEMVHIWTLAYSATAIPVSSPTAVYGAGTLFKNTTTDEKGNQVITYVDFSGDTILKKVQLADASTLSTQHAGWACTYYVYDDFNQLRYIITPKLVDYLDNNSWALTQQLVNDLCFVYAYDGKGRLISRKQPGIGETDVVYDQRDRPVFTQDALGQTNNQWKAVLYDALDRVTTTGMLQASFTPSALQTSVNASTGNITINEDAGTSANLLVTGQQNGATQYVAANSIIFQNFKSDVNGTFIAYINPNLGPIVPEAVAIADNPVPAGNPVILLTQTFYDDYSQGTKSYTTADNSLFDPSTNQQALPLPSQYDPHTRGRVTVSKVKVITNPTDLTQGNWLETDNFYDNQGRIVQTQNDNFLGGTDIVTDRYDFAGKLWGNCVKHMAGASTQLTVVSRNAYDNLGRLTDLAKNFNGTFFKDLASYTYDEYGKVTTKILAPGYTGSGKSAMETLNYNYNIQGWLTGINKAYALDQNIYDQWNDFFGLYLGYDNRDNQFTAAQLDGSVTGAIWKSQGDNSMRRYDYTYDNMGRLTGAAFLQRQTPANNWDNSVVDLSETISYTDKNGNVDKNGNIQAMVRKGLVPGVATPVTVDNLTYTYGTPSDQNSNQLARVDESANFAGNGKLYDFADGANGQGPTPDYSYDANGNLIQDQNKGITAAAGVKYNYLNKPYSVTIAGKTIISYTYDATGEKLSKTVTDLTVTPNVVTTTTYDDEFVYQNNVLQYVLHEEGRLKIITPVNSAQQQLNAGASGANNVFSGKQGVFEYFIKDQLSNVRLVLTEQSQTEFYLCSMETSSSTDPNLGTDEAKLFGKVDPTTGNPTPDNEVTLTRTLTTQTPWTGNSTANVCHLSAALTNQTIGPNMLLKVSAGDVINTSVSYFYYTNSPAGPTYTGSDAVTALIGALLGGNMAAVAEANSGAISTNLGAASSNFSSFINKYYTSNTSQAPKAFLTVLFFDEQFNFIPQDPNAPTVGTNLAQVNSANNQSATPLILGQKAPKNGYVYIYLSNESNQDVYFDNLQVSQVHGNIEEENHYYTFGQKIGGLSTIAFGGLATKYRFQGDYSEEEENTQWDEFELRNYDPQIGRWTGVDPYDQFASPYVGMGNDPVNNVDPDGGDLADVIGIAAGGGILGAAAFYFTKDQKHTTIWEDIGAAVGGAFLGSGLGYATAESLFPPSGEQPAWLNSFVAYYKGFFGANSQISVKIASPGDLNNSAQVPNMWGWVPALSLPSISLPKISLPSISLPRLLEWVDDYVETWKVIDEQRMVSEEVNPKQQGDKVLTRTLGDASDGFFRDRDVHEEGTTDVPYDPGKTKTEFIDVNATSVKDVKIYQKASKVTITVDQHVMANVGHHYNKDGTTTTNYSWPVVPTQVQIITSQRTAVPVKRLKFLGIPLPIKKRK